MTGHGEAANYVYGCRCAPCTEANRVRTRTNRLRRQGWTDAEYEQAYQDQGGLCAICGQPETRLNVRGSGLAPLSADHNHLTGVRRGLLCGRCNLMLGNVNEDVDLLQAMIDYLRYHGEDDRCK